MQSVKNKRVLMFHKCMLKVSSGSLIEDSPIFGTPNRISCPRLKPSIQDNVVLRVAAKDQIGF